jgi:uncharacterized protein YicC (UPF0701 family)
MAITMKLTENWKQDKEKLHNDIVTLNKTITDYKVARKLEWKSFKNKFNNDMNAVEKSLKNLKTLHKKY